MPQRKGYLQASAARRLAALTQPTCKTCKVHWWSSSSSSWQTWHARRPFLSSTTITTRQIVGFHGNERSRSHGDEPSQLDLSQELNRILEEDEVVDFRAEMRLEYRQR